MNASRLIPSLAVVATALLVWPGFVGAQEREPGKSVTVVTSASAKVKMVDPQRRVILLETPEGALRAIKVGKAVANLDQVKVGDEVRALALERVVVFVGKGTPGTEDAAIIARAPRGARPGILIADTDEISARIADVDAANRTITLEGAAAKPVKVSSDVDLAGVKKGDELNVHMTKGLALWVRSPEDAAQPAGAILAAQGAAGGVAGLEALDSPGVTATVEAVDRDKRTVTLKGESGATRQIHVGPAALNFDQVEVGDKVRAALTEEVAVAVSKGAALPDAGAGEGMFFGRAPEGAKPGIVIADTDRITGKVRSIDAANRTFTLDEGDGEPRTIKVGVGVNLSALNPGDDVTARTTRALAIMVEKP